MPQGLCNLVKNLPADGFQYTSQMFQGDKLELMKQEGVYPYNHMNSFNKFNSEPPNKDEFYNMLNDEHISDEDYKHAQNVWNTFGLKNMGQISNQMFCF